MGQNEWAHVNCSLWSAEVYEENGALLQVHSAVSRGRHLVRLPEQYLDLLNCHIAMVKEMNVFCFLNLQRCDHCGQSGATVGCCLATCQSNFHFMCARVQNCVFQQDRRVYCYKHKDLVSDKVSKQFCRFVVLSFNYFIPIHLYIESVSQRSDSSVLPESHWERF